MFRVISAEIKKILSKPGIYVLAVFLAVILILGVFAYKPTEFSDTAFTLAGTTYVEKYAKFNESLGKKAELDANLQDTINNVKKYTITYNEKQYNQKEYIKELIKNFETQLGEYRNCGVQETNETDILNRKNELLISLNNLSNAITTAMNNASKGSYVILSSNSNYENFKTTTQSIYDYFNVTIKQESILTYIKTYEDTYKKSYYDCLSNFVYPTLGLDKIKTYTVNEEGTTLYTLKSRLAVIQNKIADNLTIAEASGNSEKNAAMAKDMDKFANEYANTISTYINLVNNHLLSNAFDSVSAAQQMDIKYLSEYSEYNCDSKLLIYNYLFENNRFEQEYARPLTIGVSSTPAANAYDYAYFVLRLFSLIIIIFAILTTAYSVAGEIKDGTMRYLAIKPVSRTKLLFGKLIATLILSSILIIFSAIIAICVGAAVYGFSGLDILTTFNAGSVIVISPIAMISLYLISMFLELIIYSAIAMMISCLIKSDLVALVIVVFLCILNNLLPVFVTGTNTWLSFYIFSHINLYSLFGSSIYSVQDNFYNVLLGTKVYATTSLPLMIVCILVLIILPIIISVCRFKKKEL